MSKFYANYHSHRAAFRHLFDDVCSTPILLLQGASGSGKTSLITHCMGDIPFDVIRLCVQLRADSVGMEEIFSRSIDEVGTGNLRLYQQCLEEQLSQSVQLTNVAQHGTTNTINVDLSMSESAAKSRRTARLTQAWFDDMRIYNSPIVVILDAYEQAPSEVQDWISGPFLARASRCKNVRVAIAGQRVPVPGIEWGARASLLEFNGVFEPDEWVPVIRGMKKKVREPADVFIAGICQLLKGHPSDIMNFIEGLNDAPK